MSIQITEDISSLTWAESFVLNQLKRHVELNDSQLDRRVVVAVTESGKAKYERVLSLDAVRGQIDVNDVDDVAADPSPAAGTVIALVAANLADARSAYARLDQPKASGVPVVFCLPERRIVTQLDSRLETGISYQGMFSLAAGYARSIRPRQGAYCEFGVFDGRTFAIAGHALRSVCGHFYAFDSYQGIGGALEAESTHFNDGDFRANIETLRYNMRFAGLDDLPYSVVPGYFDHSLAGRTCVDDGIENISVVHIDVDVYQPAKLALDYVLPGLSNGSLLLFDDYDQLAASNDLGERRAVREWLAENQDITIEPYRSYGVFCRSFIVHLDRRGPTSGRTEAAFS